MARGAGRRSARPGGRGQGRGGPRKTGIEKYGHDEIDEALGFVDDQSDDAASNSMDELEENVMRGDEEEDPKKSFKQALKAKKKLNKQQKDEDDDDDDDEEEATSALAEAAADGTVGWRGRDFYGGDDVGGDSSDGGSDEEITLLEAKKLEQKRAARLGSLALSDPLAMLLPAATETADAAGRSAAPSKEPAEEDAPAQRSAAVAKGFAAVFEEDAECSSVQKNVAELSDSKKRSLVKREAPELIPLLQDYKSNLDALQSLQPLLKPASLERLSETSAAYLKAKAALLLNTLANLSYYVLLRAEGSAVRNHPVISQLVWLKELQRSVEPLDARLKKKLQKASKVAKKAAKGGADLDASRTPASVVSAGGVEDRAHEPPQEAPKKRWSLKERLERLRAQRSSEGPEMMNSRHGGAASGATAVENAASVSELLRLPARTRSKGSAGAPADLDDVDPTLGAWMPTSTLSQQLHSVRQYVGETARRAKMANQSADVNVEARTRKPRTRAREEPLPENQLPDGIADPGVDAEMDGLGSGSSEILRNAAAATKQKKEEMTAKQAARQEALLLRQYKPEGEVDGRRKTSKKIMENRGLLRHRKKTAGNARVANREKYQKMVKRRRGAVQEMREGAADGTYDGEATGVRTHLKKSQRLG